MLRDRGVKSIPTQKQQPSHKKTINTSEIKPIRTAFSPVAQPSQQTEAPDTPKQTRESSIDYAKHPKQTNQGIVHSLSSGIKKVFKRGKIPNKKMLLIVGGFLFLGLVIVVPLSIFSRVNNNTNSPIKGTSTEEYIERVSKFMELPKDEEPTIATVSDLDKLKGQPFFAEAKEGDVVLIYDRAAKIILYDPVANKIINAASTNIETPSPTKTEEPARIVNIALYNGTDVTGLTRTVEEDLTEKMEGINVILRDNASKSTYTNTIVIDLTGKNKTRASSIASAINGDVSTLPEGEKKPAVGGDDTIEILAIIGSDYVE